MDVSAIVNQVIAFLFALSFHEAAHAWTADRLGDPTARELGRVTMNPLAHIDPFMTVLFPAMMIMAGLPPFGAAKPVPVNTSYLKHPKRDHAWIAAAGPISNVILAIASLILVRALISDSWPMSMVPDSLATPLFSLLQMSLIVNVLLATFNMIPIPPLDGSWILTALLPEKVERIYGAIRPYGFMLLVLLIWSGMLGQIIRPVIRVAFMLTVL